MGARIQGLKRWRVVEGQRPGLEDQRPCLCQSIIGKLRNQPPGEMQVYFNVGSAYDPVEIGAFLFFAIVVCSTWQRTRGVKAGCPAALRSRLGPRKVWRGMDPQVTGNPSRSPSLSLALLGDAFFYQQIE